MIKEFYSNGKLLLSGEYAILDGAQGIGLPTIYGQSLVVSGISTPELIWKSRDHEEGVWYSCSVSMDVFTSVNSFNRQYHLFQESQDNIGRTLLQILREATILNPNFLKNAKGYEVTTTLSFPRDWGLGSSSTLINNIALWAKVDPYILSSKTLGGSGYDIACANHNSPILYSLQHGKATVKELPFNPSFKDYIYFVYLNQKQNSRDGIKAYNTIVKNKELLIKTINNITQAIAVCTELTHFEKLLREHEEIIGEMLQTQPIQKRLFADFSGTIKSLGAWGGDFLLATSQEDPTSYFNGKGYPTVLPYADMILQKNLPE